MHILERGNMKKQRISTLLISAIVMLLGITSVQASESALTELLKVLREDGTLSETKYQAIVQLVIAEKGEKVTKAATEQITAEALPAVVPQVKITTKGKLEIASADEEFKMRIGGRVMIDGAIYDDDIAALGSGAEMRRARLFAQGTLWKVWNYKLQYDFTGTGKAAINDAYIQYTGLPAGDIKVGHFKEPYSLQNMTSSKYVTFMERGLSHLLTPGRSIGLAYGTNGSNWSANAGLFAQGIDTTAGENDQSYAVTGRVTFAPIFVKGQEALHFGAGYSYRNLDNSQSLRFRERPESHITNVRLIDTGNFDADSLQRFNLEGLWMQGPFAIQGEYSRVSVDRVIAGNPDVNFDGYYIEASWFLTGETMNYNPKKGALSKISPKGILGKGGYGTWQVATRFSSLNLSDQDINGGEEDNFTLGLNWYPNSNLRFMANYVKVLDVDAGPHAGDEPSVFSLRAQVEF